MDKYITMKYNTGITEVLEHRGTRETDASACDHILLVTLGKSKP